MLRYNHIQSLIIFLTCICFLSIPLPLQADTGKSGWPIFKKSQTACFKGTAALSPAYGNVSGAIYNPAMLGTIQQPGMLLNSELGFAEDTLGSFYYYLPLNKSVISCGLGYYHVGNIELNWIENNNELQSETVIAQQDIFGQVSYAYRLHNFWAGISLKAARSELVQRAAAIAIAGDIGLAVMPYEQWIVSLALMNAGFSTKYQEKEVPLPLSGYLGSGYLFAGDNWHILPGVGTTYNLVDKTWLPEAGLELKYGIVLIDVGYCLNKQEANMHFGFGIQWQNFRINYAFVPGNFLDPIHRVSVVLQFGETVQPKAGSGYTEYSRKTSSRQVVAPAIDKPREQYKPKHRKTTKYGKKIPLVRKVSLKKAGQRIKVRWNKPRSAHKFRYNVYMKTGRGKYRKVNTRMLKKTAYTSKLLKRKRTYYFSITSINAQGRESYRTKPKKIFLR